MKAIQLLINSFLPDDLKNYSQTYDVKGMNKILTAVARKYPDRFAEISKNIADVGRKASYIQGETIGLEDLLPVIDKKPIFAQMDNELKALSKKDKDYDNKRIEIWSKYNGIIEKETARAALDKNNSIALAVLSGARGKVPQLKAMVSTPGLYTDYKDNIIPMMIQESFAEGIRPAAWLGSTFGARSSVISTKTATAKGGDLAKQLASTCVDLVVRKPDCGTSNGIALKPTDNSLRGRVLAKDTGEFPAGTIINRDVLAKLQKLKQEHIQVRSAMTCTVPNGLCSKCVGAFYNGGKMPKVGEAVGSMASTAVAEPITQMALNSKHQGGMAKGKKTFAGMEYIQQFTQSPETFRDRATVSEVDGKVTDIHEAPQGGYYVTVGEEKHYIPAGHEVEVKVGDTIEAGDQLANGLIDPEDVVRLKGLGEGRHYYASRFNQMLQDSGVGTDKRNTEVVARGAIRHVQINSPEGLGIYLPDDIVDYNTLQATYEPPETSQTLAPRHAIGKYLQVPTLHYSIGTRITPKVAQYMQDYGAGDITVDDFEPQFSAKMVRLRTASHSNPDWLASLGTSHLTKQLNESATRGDDTNIQENSDYRPRLAVGVGFGKNITQTGNF